MNCIPLCRFLRSKMRCNGQAQRPCCDQLVSCQSEQAAGRSALCAAHALQDLEMLVWCTCRRQGYCTKLSFGGRQRSEAPDKIGAADLAPNPLFGAIAMTRHAVPTEYGLLPLTGMSPCTLCLGMRRGQGRPGANGRHRPQGKAPERRAATTAGRAGRRRGRRPRRRARRERQRSTEGEGRPQAEG